MSDIAQQCEVLANEVSSLRRRLQQEKAASQMAQRQYAAAMKEKQTWEAEAAQRRQLLSEVEGQGMSIKGELATLSKKEQEERDVVRQKTMKISNLKAEYDAGRMQAVHDIDACSSAIEETKKVYSKEALLERIRVESEMLNKCEQEVSEVERRLRDAGTAEASTRCLHIRKQLEDVLLQAEEAEQLLQAAAARRAELQAKKELRVQEREARKAAAAAAAEAKAAAKAQEKEQKEAASTPMVEEETEPQAEAPPSEDAIARTDVLAVVKEYASKSFMVTDALTTKFLPAGHDLRGKNCKSCQADMSAGFVEQCTSAATAAAEDHTALTAAIEKLGLPVPSQQELESN